MNTRTTDIRLYEEEEDRRSRRRKDIRSVVVVASLIVLLFPFETDVLPQLKFRVIQEETGQPMNGVKVNQRWANYSAEFREHEDYSTTDNDGFVSFPERNISTNLLARMLRPAINLLWYGRNARWGPQAFLYAYVSDAEWGFAHYLPDTPPQEVIEVRHGNR